MPLSNKISTMKITHLELNGYKRFMLNEIDHFSMKWTSPLSVIIGTNGCGKSSLLQQLTPLPPNPADFIKTGSKTIHIEHRGSVYILKSIFHPNQRHYFEKDGVVLNDYSTLAVQKELVKTHFKVDQSVFNLLIGEDRFHSMSPSRRKEWFIELCETDYDYAISTYNKLREKHRDIQGGLKIAQRKLATETAKIIKKEDERRIQAEVTLLHQTLSELLEYRKPVDKDIQSIEEQQNRLSTTLLKTAQRVQTLLKQLGSQVRYQEPQLQLVLSGLSQRTYAIQTLMQKASSEYQVNLDRITILQKAEHQNITSLQNDLLVLKNQINTLEQKLIFYTDDFNAVLAEESFNQVKTTLADLFIRMPANPDRKYSSEKLTAAREQLDEFKRQLTGGYETIATLKAQVQHMENHRDHPDVTCVKCEHRFSLNFHPQLHRQHLLDIQTLTDKLTNQLKPKITQLESYIEQCAEYARDYRLFVTTTQNASVLKPYWDMLVECQVLTHNPQGGISELNRITSDLVLQRQVSECNKVNQEKTALLHSLKNVGTSNLQDLIKINAELSEQIESHTKRLVTFQDRHQQYTQTLTQLRQVNQLHTQLQSLIEEKNNLTSDAIESHRRILFNDMIRALQSMLGAKEHVLSEAKLQQGIINSVIKQIIDLEAEERAYSALVKSLSPTDGLIAEGLYGFISAFVKQMNHIIAKVWSYPMVIQTCEIDADSGVDLDYKFAVKVGDDELLSPDVSKVSKGQKEIIDLAFLMVAMTYMDMRDSALLLDELGAALDAEHRSCLILLLKTLIEQESFSQVALVSHDHHQYSSLNAQFCVLNATNVLLPAHYNDHVVMR
jgi:DNA repair exonuclease SbcCD ATPase subunit